MKELYFVLCFMISSGFLLSLSDKNFTINDLSETQFFLYCWTTFSVLFMIIKFLINLY